MNRFAFYAFFGHSINNRSIKKTSPLGLVKSHDKIIYIG